MIGETPETAIPTVIFCCRDEHHRTAAMESIEKSCILDDYPDFALRHSPQAPMSTNGLVMMSGSVARDTLQMSRQEDVTLQMPRPAISETDNLGSWIPTGTNQPGRYNPKMVFKTVAVPVFSEGSHLGSGSPLLTEGAKTAGEGAHATVGGTIIVHGERYIMTAAHPFIYGRSNVKDQNGCEDPEIIAGTFFEGRSMSTRLRIGSFFLPQQSELLPSVGNLWFSSMVESESRPELDYALIAPSKGVLFTAHFDITALRQSTYLQLPKFASGKDLQYTVDTRAYTKAASLLAADGEVDPMPAFIRLPNTQKYQEVYSVQFSQPLAKGDCGAWVIHTSSQSLLGHIVAGSPKDGLVYIVPFYQVAEDLKKVFQLSPSHGYNSSAESTSAEARHSYDTSADSTYTQANRLGLLSHPFHSLMGRFRDYLGIRDDGLLSPTMQSRRCSGPYDAVGYIRRDGDVYDRDEVYEEYRPYDPYGHDSYHQRS